MRWQGVPISYRCRNKGISVVLDTNIKRYKVDVRTFNSEAKDFMNIRCIMLILVDQRQPCLIHSFLQALPF